MTLNLQTLIPRSVFYESHVDGSVFIFLVLPPNLPNYSGVLKHLSVVQEAYPVKLKEVHVVNVSPIVDTIVNFVKPFLKEKTRNRVT